MGEEKDATGTEVTQEKKKGVTCNSHGIRRDGRLCVHVLEISELIHQDHD